MVFLLLPGYSGHTSRRGARCAAPKSRHGRVAKRRSYWKGTRSLRGGRSPKPGGRGTRVLNAEPQGAAPAPARCPSNCANGKCAETMPAPARNDGGLTERDSGGAQTDTGRGCVRTGRESAKGLGTEGVQAGGVFGGAADALRHGPSTRRWATETRPVAAASRLGTKERP